VTSRSRWTVLWAAALVPVSAPQAGGQDLRTITAARQSRGEERLDLRVEFAAGKLHLAPATGNVLYRMRLTYDDALFEPVHTFDAQSGRAELGVRGRKNADWHQREGGPGQTLEVSVGLDVPVALDLVIGAGKAEIDLGGLVLTRVSVAAGATETKVRWAVPNRGRCTDLALKVGAATFEAEGLGNAGCERIEVMGGAGEMTLDFSGAWKEDMAIDLKVALASLDLRFPRDVGIAIESRRLLASLDQPGFTSRDGMLYSKNWESANRRVRITAHATLGGLSIGWIDPTSSR